MNLVQPIGSNFLDSPIRMHAIISLNEFCFLSLPQIYDLVQLIFNNFLSLTGSERFKIVFLRFFVAVYLIFV